MSLENFTISHARDLDQSDQLRDFRSKFNFPIDDQGNEQLYFTGHSLGLMPKQTKDYLEETLSSWSNRAVEGHFKGEHPWMYSHDQVSKQMASIVGAKEDLVSTEIDNVKYINFAEENNSLFFSTSAKLGTNIEELFEEIASDLKNSKNHRISEISSDTSTFYAFGKNISSNFSCCYY